MDDNKEEVSKWGNCKKCGSILKRVAYSIPSKGFYFGDKGVEPLTVCEKCYNVWKGNRLKKIGK